MLLLLWHKLGLLYIMFTLHMYMYYALLPVYIQINTDIAQSESQVINGMV